MITNERKPSRDENNTPEGVYLLTDPTNNMKKRGRQKNNSRIITAIQLVRRMST
jgi:hypothetical protein